jgi:hypothetical protein
MHKGQTIEELIQMADNVISKNCLDGVGVPYYNQPDGVYHANGETEDELEMARR